MRGELVSIPTSTVPLDGMFYEPEAVPARGAVLLFHGNMGNFYTGPSRFLPAALVANGFACLAFNRSDHWYAGYEFEVSQAVVEWLKATGLTS